MIGAKIISPDATLNTWKCLGSIDFIPGTAITIALQILDLDKNIRFVPPSTCEVTFTFNKIDGTQFEIAGVFVDAGDRSLIKTTIPATPALTASNSTVNLSSGNFTFTLDLLGDGTEILEGVVYNALRRVDTTQF